MREREKQFLFGKCIETFVKLSLSAFQRRHFELQISNGNFLRVNKVQKIFSLKQENPKGMLYIYIQIKKSVGEFHTRFNQLINGKIPGGGGKGENSRVTYLKCITEFMRHYVIEKRIYRGR